MWQRRQAWTGRLGRIRCGLLLVIGHAWPVCLLYSVARLVCNAAVMKRNRLGTGLEKTERTTVKALVLDATSGRGCVEERCKVVRLEG